MDKRAEMVAGLRAMANMMEDGRTPLPYDVSVNVYFALDPEAGNITGDMTQDVARNTMATFPGNWTKNSTTPYITYVRHFGERVTYEVNVPRGTVCKQVQVGTRHVEAVPAHDEAVYEWDCTGTEDE